MAWPIDKSNAPTSTTTGTSPYGDVKSVKQFGSSNNDPKAVVTQRYGGIDTTKLGGAVEQNILDRLAGNKSGTLASTTTGAFNALARASRDIQGQATANAYQSGLNNQGAGVSASQQANRDILGAISQTHLGIADIAAKENAEAVDQGSKLLELKSSENVQLQQLSDQQAQAEKNRKLDYLKFLVDSGVAPELFDEANNDTFKDIFGFDIPQETKDQIKTGQEKAQAKLKATDFAEKINLLDLSERLEYFADGVYYKDPANDNTPRPFTAEELEALSYKGIDPIKLNSQYVNFKANLPHTIDLANKGVQNMGWLIQSIDNPRVVKELQESGLLTISPDLATISNEAKGNFSFIGALDKDRMNTKKYAIRYHYDSSTQTMYYSQAGYLYSAGGNIINPVQSGGE